MNRSLVRRYIFPVHEKLRGRSTQMYYEALSHNDRSSVDAREERLGRLRAMLEHCRTQVPYYRELFRQYGLNSFADFFPEELTSLPILERDAVQSNARDMVADNYNERVFPVCTGGSSGKPLRFYTDWSKEARQNAGKWRFRGWFGVRPGDREVDFWGAPAELGRLSLLRRWKDRFLLNHVVLSAHNLTDERVRAYANFISRFRPQLVYGYPSVIVRVARIFAQEPVRARDYQPRLTVCTSEILHPQTRKEIEHGLKCPVANEYGARDGGLIAHECPEGSLHIAADHVIVEVDKPDDSGVGDLLVTNLDGFGMPFVRYRIGDRGKLSDDPCRCGSHLPVIATLQGRTNEFLIGADGREVHGSAANYVFRELPDVLQYRLVQTRERDIDVWLVAVGEPQPLTLERIRNGLRRILGEEIEVRVHPVGDIPRPASGKHRWVESEARSE